jgi:hypothetical protein
MERNAEGVFELVPAEPALSPEGQRRRDRDNELRRHRRRLSPEQLAEHKAATRAAQVEHQRREYAEAVQSREADEPGYSSEGLEDLLGFPVTPTVSAEDA